jgi:AraC-like DNA-binding protein
MLIPAACKVLADLRVSASLCMDGPWGVYWAVFQSCRDVLTLELEHGAWNERHEYNERCLKRARGQQISVIGSHAGFCDVFVPVCVAGRVSAVIVSGPFARSRPTSTEVLERWRRVTGRQANASEPEFSQYVELTLSTLVLNERQQQAFQKLLEHMASLMAEPSLVSNAHDAEKALGVELRPARFVEIVWEAAEAMVDASTTHIWTRPSQFIEQREALGLMNVPDQVLVGLFVSRRRDADPVDELLRGHEFQRACVELAHARGNVVSGRVGGHGITFVAATAGGPRDRRRPFDLAEEVTRIAKRRFDLDLYFGAGAPRATLPVQYQAALAAAETALSRGELLVHASAVPPALGTLGTLRQELARQLGENPKALPARFDRFLEVVAAHTGHRLEPARIHLETTLERLCETASENGTLDGKGLESVREDLERAVGTAHTLSQLFAAYRRAAQDLAEAANEPTPAHQDRNLRRAEEFVREHYGEALSLTRVARVAGFAPSYFSHLFHQRHRRTFIDYLTALRIGRAKELLAGTTLNVQRIAELSGLSRSQYLSRLFKKATSLTPIEYRRRATTMRDVEHGRVHEPGRVRRRGNHRKIV